MSLIPDRGRVFSPSGQLVWFSHLNVPLFQNLNVPLFQYLEYCPREEAVNYRPSSPFL